MTPSDMLVKAVELGQNFLVRQRFTMVTDNFKVIIRMHLVKVTQ